MTFGTARSTSCRKPSQKKLKTRKKMIFYAGEQKNSQIETAKLSVRYYFQVSVDLYKILAENTKIKMTCGNEVFDHKEILQLFSLTSEKIHKTVSFALV